MKLAAFAFISPSVMSTDIKLQEEKFIIIGQKWLGALLSYSSSSLTFWNQTEKQNRIIGGQSNFFRWHQNAEPCKHRIAVTKEEIPSVWNKLGI